jgi:hypothetical protein
VEPYGRTTVSTAQAAGIPIPNYSNLQCSTIALHLKTQPRTSVHPTCIFTFEKELCSVRRALRLDLRDFPLMPLQTKRSSQAEDHQRGSYLSAACLPFLQHAWPAREFARTGELILANKYGNTSPRHVKSSLPITIDNALIPSLNKDEQQHDVASL